MTPFDYYVSGLKIHHQVPRFQGKALINGTITDFDLNDVFETTSMIAVVFIDQMIEKKALIAESFNEDLTLIYISLDDINQLKKTVQSPSLIVSDKTHEIAHLFGVLDEHTHRIYNTVVLIKNTGQCHLILSGLNEAYFKENFPSKLSEFI